MCDQQASATTNVVDVNWTVTVIDKLRLPPLGHIAAIARCGLLLQE